MGIVTRNRDRARGGKVKQRSVKPEDVKQENIDFIYIYYI